jgi:hypothetical protein
MESMRANAHDHARVRRLALPSVVALIASLLAMALGGASAGAAQKVIVLGAATPATPSCPTNCQAVGKTTGFQNKITGAKNPFSVTTRGSIVAWSIKLGAPSSKPNPQNNNQSDIDFFNKTFGGSPSARLSVLKPIQKDIKAGNPNYQLKKQSPVEDLSDFLGQTTTFTLDTPLRVKPGQIVALTVPTWAPAFAVNQSADTKWTASRSKGKCTDTADILAGSAQQDLGSTRSYACGYNTARLLYSATVVADGAAPAPSKPGNKK